jgi:hypothetical protein
MIERAVKPALVNYGTGANVSDAGSDRVDIGPYDVKYSSSRPASRCNHTVSLKRAVQPLDIPEVLDGRYMQV